MKQIPIEDIKPEAKVITYLSEKEVGEDIHIVKEVKYVNGKYIDDIKIIKDYKRPFYITKPMFRNHKDKKESEKLEHVNKFMSTESKLYTNVSRRIGESFTGKVDIRKLKRSQYLYGTDVDARTYLKQSYIKANDNFLSPYRVGVFDIEFNVLTSEIIILSIATRKHLKVTLLKSYADTIPDIYNRLDELYEKYIPNVKFKKNMKKEVIVFDTEMDMIRYVFHEANYMDIDILTAWNIKYDITQILDVIEKNEVEPADIFHYDKIPEKYKYFKFTPGREVKTTEAGREIAMNVEEQWHIIKTTANYQMLDNMASHRYIRAGGATVSGGYSLDNILKEEGVAQKLKFSSNQGFKGIEWHIDMVANRPAEYITYNQWDDMSVLALDEKTKDLSISFPLLTGMSHPDIFNSGPRRIVDALTFFYLDRGLVLGVKEIGGVNDKILDLKGWVLTLDSYMTMDIGLDNIEETKELISNIKSFVMDIDAIASYPSDTMAANVSKDTTHRELIAVNGITKALFKLQNMNLMYGKTNALEYCQTIHKMPSLYEAVNHFEKEEIIAC